MQALLEATHNRALTSLTMYVAAAVRWTTRFKQAKRRCRRDAMPEHVAPRDEVAARSPERA